MLKIFLEIQKKQKIHKEEDMELYGSIIYSKISEYSGRLDHEY